MISDKEMRKRIEDMSPQELLKASETFEALFDLVHQHDDNSIANTNPDYYKDSAVLSVKNICPRCGKKIESGEFHKLPQCIDYLIGRVCALEDENLFLTKRNTELEDNFSQFIVYLRRGHNEKAHLQMLVLETLVEEGKTKRKRDTGGIDAR